MDVERIWSNEKQLHALTGLKLLEAEDLLKSFQSEVELKKEQAKGPGGRAAKLSDKEIFVMLMMFFRHYISLEALGALFDLDDSNVKRWIDEAQSMLLLLLKKKNYFHVLAQKTPQNLEKFLKNKTAFI